MTLDYEDGDHGRPIYRCDAQEGCPNTATLRKGAYVARMADGGKSPPVLVARGWVAQRGNTGPHYCPEHRDQAGGT
jgi:hypothetical protein